MPWEALVVFGGVAAWIFSSLKKRKGAVIVDARILDDLNRARQSAADKERARIEEIEDEIHRNLMKRRHVEEDSDGAVDRLRDEFGTN